MARSSEDHVERVYVNGMDRHSKFLKSPLSLYPPRHGCRLPRLANHARVAHWLCLRISRGEKVRREAKQFLQFLTLPGKVAAQANAIKVGKTKSFGSCLHVS